MSRRIAVLILLFSTVFASLACSRRVPDERAETARSAALPHAVNINTATREQLQAIPHIGESLAAKIVEHRERHGPFRRPEHLMLLPGISDTRFRRIRPLIRVE